MTPGFNHLIVNPLGGYTYIEVLLLRAKSFPYLVMCSSSGFPQKHGPASLGPAVAARGRHFRAGSATKWRHSFLLKFDLMNSRTVSLWALEPWTLVRECFVRRERPIFFRWNEKCKNLWEFGRDSSMDLAIQVNACGAKPIISWHWYRFISQNLWTLPYGLGSKLLCVFIRYKLSAFLKFQSHLQHPLLIVELPLALLVIVQ